MSVKFHTQDGRIYRLHLRGAYSHWRSEAQFRKNMDTTISHFEKNPNYREYGRSLRAKWENGKEFDVMSILGILNKKERIK